MIADYLVCPECGQGLESCGDVLTCPSCRQRFPVREGVPSFADPSAYWGEIGYQEMRQTNEAAIAGGWENAIREIEPLLPNRSVSYVADNNRADWRLVLPSMANWRVLDLGAGWGTLTFALAPFCREIMALEGVWERARFVEIRRSQSGMSNVSVIHADACRPPLATGVFDLTVVNGLLEWVALRNTGGDPRDVQRDFLARLGRLLRPGGWLYVGIENRIGEASFRGAVDHSGLPYTMLLPRAMARWHVRRKSPEYRAQADSRYRTYTYSFWGYRRLLREAGFELVDAYWVHPSYNLPRHLIPLDSRHAAAFYLHSQAYGRSMERLLLGTARRMLVRMGAARLLASNFCFVGQRI